MDQQFTHIGTVLFRHTYFEESLFVPLESTLDAQSQKVLRNLGMLLKPFDGGIHILTSDISLLKSLREDKPLRIALRCNDSYYINYTELPIFQPGSDCLCFQNLDVTNTEGTSVLRLQKETFVGANEVMKISHEKLSLTSFDPEAKYTFTNASKIHLTEPYVQRSNTGTNQFVFKDIPEGIIYVLENNVHKESLYYQPDGLRSKPLGILELYPSALIDHYHENDEKVTYTIDFEARKTVWKYFVIQNSTTPFQKLTIINSVREEVFERDNGSNGTIVFNSKTPHPLSNSSGLPLQLVNNFIPGERKESIVVQHLPNPSPRQLYLNESSTDISVESHIYVYI